MTWSPEGCWLHGLSSLPSLFLSLRSLTNERHRKGQGHCLSPNHGQLPVSLDNFGLWLRDEAFYLFFFLTHTTSDTKCVAFSHSRNQFRQQLRVPQFNSLLTLTTWEDIGFSCQQLKIMFNPECLKTSNLLKEERGLYALLKITLEVNDLPPP